MPESFQSYIIEGLPDTTGNLEWLRTHFECEQCGQCCLVHTVGVRITRPEAEHLAQREHLSISEYLANVIEDRDTFLIPQPCRYLINHRCTVHDIKPSVCRKYPFHQRKVVNHKIAWVVISGCPGSQKLLKLLTIGKQLGLQYLPFR
jgi:Fe-S-cluster containining protein